VSICPSACRSEFSLQHAGHAALIMRHLAQLWHSWSCLDRTTSGALEFWHRHVIWHGRFASKLNKNRLCRCLFHNLWILVSFKVSKMSLRDPWSIFHMHKTLYEHTWANKKRITQIDTHLWLPREELEQLLPKNSCQLTTCIGIRLGPDRIATNRKAFCRFCPPRWMVWQCIHVRAHAKWWRHLTACSCQWSDWTAGAYIHMHIQAYTHAHVCKDMHRLMYVHTWRYCDLQNEWESLIFQRTFPVGFTTSKTFTAGSRVQLFCKS
jgi:hypothetical protein